MTYNGKKRSNWDIELPTKESNKFDRKCHWTFWFWFFRNKSRNDDIQKFYTILQTRISKSQKNPKHECIMCGQSVISSMKEYVSLRNVINRCSIKIWDVRLIQYFLTDNANEHFFTSANENPSTIHYAFLKARWECYFLFSIFNGGTKH